MPPSLHGAGHGPRNGLHEEGGGTGTETGGHQWRRRETEHVLVEGDGRLSDRRAPGSGAWQLVGGHGAGGGGSRSHGGVRRGGRYGCSMGRVYGQWRRSHTQW